MAVPRLSLGELRCATCGLETVLLSFLHTRVARQEACLLQAGLKGFISLYESAGETVADSACLTGETAATNGSNDIKLTEGLGNAEGLVNDELQGFKTEVLINVLAVNGDNTAAGIKTNAGNGLLSSAGAVEIRLYTCIHSFILLFPKLVQNDRLLCGMVVLCTAENLKARDGLIADGVVGEHALDSKRHSKLGTLFHQFVIADSL